MQQIIDENSEIHAPKSSAPPQSAPASEGISTAATAATPRRIRVWPAAQAMAGGPNNRAVPHVPFSEHFSLFLESRKRSNACFNAIPHANRGAL
jgi:hypothetical protein